MDAGRHGRPAELATLRLSEVLELVGGLRIASASRLPRSVQKLDVAEVHRHPTDDRGVVELPGP